MLPAGAGFVTGMRSEARLLGRRPLRIAGGSAERARALAGELAAEGVTALVSFGIAGGLAPQLRPGALIIGHRVLVAGTGCPCDPAASTALASALPGAFLADIAASTGALANAADKQRLHAATGAVAVDMESGGIALAAQAAGLPLLVIRAVADDAQTTLPPAALAGLAPDGSVAMGAVIASLIMGPIQFPGLLRVACASATAMKSLRWAVESLGG